VYSLRSNALHAGNPFPLPMCLSPRIFLQSGEVPMVTGALGATWERKETPILLSAFERIAREAIVNYFLSRTD
ncbi:MAG TPA: hypothetical protein VK610_03625, partial [Rhodothermales bacterium]|nr:hypothetical protein [Rhodothermales bacterium]